MSALPSLYRAKAVKVTGRQLQAFVPQVFGDTSIIIDSFLGDIPSSAGMGWVFFQGGDAAFPVWSSGFSGNGDGGDTESWADEIEDLQEADVAIDARLDALEAGGGGTGTDEVWVGPSQPSDPAIELWYDTDAPSASSVDRWNSAWGVIATGTFVPPYAPHVVTTTEALTNAVTATLITGRRYRVSAQIRAINNLSGPNQLSFYLSDNGTQIRGHWGGGDPYVWSQGAYQGLNYEWHFLGDNTPHSFVLWVAPGANMNIYTDYGLWYIEDIGPISYGIPPAVDPTPTAVAWTPIIPLNNWTLPGGTEVQPGFRKIGDVVYLKGSLMGGATPPALGQSAFQLPAGYYNTILTRVSLNGFLSNGNTFACRVDLINSGAFVPTNTGGGAVGTGTFLQLNGVSWPVGVS